MTKRIVVAVIAALLLIPAVILGGIYFIIVSFVLIGVATHELINLRKEAFNNFMKIIIYVAVYSLTYWVYLKNLLDITNIDLYTFNEIIAKATVITFIYISPIAIGILILLLAIFVLIFPKFTINDALFYFATIIIASLSLQAISFLRNYPLFDLDPMNTTSAGNYERFFASSKLLIYALISSFSADIGAYFVGIFFGRHKLIERLSPKKTWEGFFGGIAFSFVFSFSFAIIFAIIGKPIVPILDLEHWYYILGLSLIAPLFAVVGDLVFSAIKRHFNVKDFGAFFPGHGGVLDRIDSLLFVSLFMAMSIILMHNNWQFGIYV
jgi:phosphatidate cytidylyltransferase